MPATTSNAALRVRYLAPAEITPAPRNARTHSPAQVQQIARSIGEFGFTNPILLDEAATILAGHGRLEAAKGLGLDKVPTITLAGLSDAQKRALALADNRLALSAGWDEDTLRLELDTLQTLDFDVSLIGFSDNELAQILAPHIDLADEWAGMPEFEQADKTAFQTVAIHFRDQAGVDAFARLIGQKITDKTRFTWFPIEAEEQYIDKRYAA